MNKNIEARSIKFKYQTGVSATGKPKYSYNTIGNIDSAVSDEIILGMVEVIAKVQQTPSADVEIAETTVLN